MQHRTLALPSALCTFNAKGHSQTFLINTSNADVILEKGTQVCQYLLYGTKVHILDEIPNTVFSVTHNARKPTDITNHLNQTDYPKDVEALVKLLEKYHHVVALPNEKLDTIDILEHHIT